ncbi:MAG: hypothetical protein Q7J27_08655 [Syntrophales bacterium]|nr:hypothetical protein [Syntrophales bacterium]
MKALHNAHIVIASEAKQSHNILIIHKIATAVPSLRSGHLAMTKITVLQRSQNIIQLGQGCMKISKKDVDQITKNNFRGSDERM